MRTLTKICSSALTVVIAGTTLQYATPAFAHSGGTDSSGCHTNQSTGDYHCHTGGASGGSYGTYARPDSCSPDELFKGYVTRKKEELEYLGDHSWWYLCPQQNRDIAVKMIEDEYGITPNTGASPEPGIFKDVPYRHEYISAIKWGKDTNLLKGYEDGTFQPERIVNRAEFLKIVLEAKNVDVDSDSTPTGFSDVDENAWYAPYVRYAKTNSVIQGYADGTFKPEQSVNFAEALKMAYVALGIQSDSTEGEWYERYLQHAKTKSILFNNNVDISVGMTRKDVVWIVWKLKENRQNSEDKNTSATSQSSKSPTSYSFPLNLLENQQWAIEMRVVNDILKDNPIFTIERNGDNFTLKAEKENSRTGELEPYQYYSDNKFEAGFEKHRILDNTEVFQVEECHYRYEYIHEDYRCTTFAIPYNLVSGQVEGKEIYMSDYEETVLSEGTYSVKIIHKSGKNVKCNVKAETYVGDKIYYLSDSEYFQTTRQFRCFEDEDDAIKAGYKKSHR